MGILPGFEHWFLSISPEYSVYGYLCVLGALCLFISIIVCVGVHVYLCVGVEADADMAILTVQLRVGQAGSHFAFQPATPIITHLEPWKRG